MCNDITESLDVSTELGAYILGILWGIGSRNEEGYLIRHRNSWFLECAKNYLQIPNACFMLDARTGKQTVLKIRRALYVDRIDQLLLTHGWQPRNAFERPYPRDNINDRGFIRAWVELHSSIDIAHIGRKRNPTPRLRVYGNEHMMRDMNLVISAATGLKPRTLQKTANEITKALYYHGSSVRVVYDWLYSEPVLCCVQVCDLFEMTLFR